VKLVAYVRAGAAEALADPLAYVEGDLEPARQQRAMSRWASKRKMRIVEVVIESGRSDDAIEDRIGLAHALEMIADRAVAGVLVARLDRLAADIVVQELLRAHVHRLGGEILSAAADEETIFAEPCGDEARALIRRVVEKTPEIDGALRSVRALYRRGRTPIPGDREGALLADLDATPFVRIAENVVRNAIPTSMRRRH